MGADRSMSVINQVVQFTALFAIWYQDFQCNRLIKTLVF